MNICVTGKKNVISFSNTSNNFSDGDFHASRYNSISKTGQEKS